ncbi:MAG: efflux RND transporter permease subunit [Wenzhouxiangellaceae bacterium]|nr:efflux RND transporter permease subunit [Wenzhouxiangellaceae bacterium]
MSDELNSDKATPGRESRDQGPESDPDQQDPSRGSRYYRGLTHAAIRRPVGTTALAMVVLVMGLFFVDRLPVNLLPEVVYPLIRVNVNYPGASPEVVEEQVTRPLERALASTENLLRMSSEAEEGRTDVSLIFDYGTDLDSALQNASRLLERARSQLPDDVEPPRLRKWDPGSSSVFQAGFSSDLRTPREVRDWADNRLAPQLQSIPGVSGVEAIGGQERELEVIIDQQRLRSFGLTLTGVADQLAQENLNVAAGNVTSSSMDVMARTDGRFQSPEDIAKVLLAVPDSDRRIRLDEVAEVRDGYREQRLFVRLDGVPATQVSVFKQPEANTVAVVDALIEQLSSLKASGFIPDDISYKITEDAAFFIRGSVKSVSAAAILGGVLAMVVVLAFLGSLRKAFVIGLSIPLAVMATFAMMGAAGLSLNVMSLGGLALGVGLLLDNAIVMLENISRHREKLGKSADMAAHEGADEVMSAVTAGTLTNLAAVVPFLLITGLATLVFRELLVTISFAVIASLAVALTLVPMLAAQFARVRFESGFNRLRVYRGFSALIEWLSDQYRGLLRGLIAWRWGVVAGGVCVFVGSLLLASRLGNEFLPQLDDGELGIRMSLPAGVTPQETNAATRLIEAEVRQMPHVESAFALAGGNVWGGVANERPGRGYVLVRLSNAADRPEWPASRWVAEAQQRMDALDIAGARMYVWSPGIRGLTFGVSGEDMELKVVGEDIGVLQDVAREVIDRLETIPGLNGVEMDDEDRTPLLSINVDRERASALGLDIQDISQSLRYAVSGYVPTRYSTGVNEYDVRVRLPREDVGDIEALGQVIVANGANGPIQARQVASFNLEEGPAGIGRENQVRIQRIVGNFDTALNDVGTIMSEVQRRIDEINMPSQYGVILGGQFETIRETNREMAIVIALAVFLVFVVLAVQYEKLSNPLVIMTAAPLATAGSALVLWLTATPISAPVFLGAVLLVGIVVNNAILLVEYIERRRKQGWDIYDAVVEAGGIRLRPILMTTLTTVVGMLPLAIGAGSGAMLMQPLAIAVVGGLLSAMLLTLLLVPCLYIIIQNAAGAISDFLTRRKSSAGASSDTLSRAG